MWGLRFLNIGVILLDYSSSHNHVHVITKSEFATESKMLRVNVHPQVEIYPQPYRRLCYTIDSAACAFLILN